MNTFKTYNILHTKTKTKIYTDNKSKTQNLKLQKDY